MPADVTRSEFQHLQARVNVVEGEVEGEKLVTRHILEQTRRNGDDLAAIKTRLDRVERKLDGLEQKFDGLEQKVGGLEQKVDGLEQKVDGLEQNLGGLGQKVGGLEQNLNGLRKDLPKIVGDTMREVLRERDGEQ